MIDKKLPCTPKGRRRIHNLITYMYLHSIILPLTHVSHVHKLYKSYNTYQCFFFFYTKQS